MKDKDLFCLLHFPNEINHLQARPSLAPEMKHKHTLCIEHQVL